MYSGCLALWDLNLLWTTYLPISLVDKAEDTLNCLPCLLVDIKSWRYEFGMPPNLIAWGAHFQLFLAFHTQASGQKLVVPHVFNLTVSVFQNPKRHSWTCKGHPILLPHWCLPLCAKWQEPFSCLYLKCFFFNFFLKYKNKLVLHCIFINS